MRLSSMNLEKMFKQVSHGGCCVDYAGRPQDDCRCDDEHLMPGETWVHCANKWCVVRIAVPRAKLTDFLAGYVGGYACGNTCAKSAECSRRRPNRPQPCFPTDARGRFLPCPLCGRRYCDHTLDERGDAVWR